MSSHIPADFLEKRAADQRLRLHHSVEDLRHAVKETLDIKHTAHEFFWTATGAAIAIGLILGYGLAGVFTRD